MIVMTDQSYFMMIHATQPFASARDIAKMFNRTESWVRKVRKEIIDCNRYSDTWPVINEDGDTFLNIYVLLDFLKYRGALKNKNVARHLPPYSASAVRQVLGDYKVPAMAGGEKNEGTGEMGEKF